MEGHRLALASVLAHQAEVRHHHPLQARRIAKIAACTVSFFPLQPFCVSNRLHTKPPWVTPELINACSRFHSFATACLIAADALVLLYCVCVQSYSSSAERGVFTASWPG